MSVSKHPIYVGAALVLAVLLITGASIWWSRSHASPKESSAISVMRAQMAGDIKRLGAKEAYKAFAAEYHQKSFTVQHNSAHLFGEALYDTVGLTGIAACDLDFNYGCFHGFMTEAIAQKGPSVISKLKEACAPTPSPLACEHGIGHGIIEYLGHDKLLPALKACDLTNPTDPIAGCRTGLFMEYNIPIVFDESGDATINARLLADPAKPYDVCPSLPEQYQLACYYSLPQWWIQVYGDYKDRLKEFCQNAPGRPNEMGCATGLGSVSGMASHYDPEKAKEYCMPGMDKELEDRCLISSAQAFYADVADMAATKKLCSLVTSKDQHECTF
jgi:hypothetical protein